MQVVYRDFKASSILLDKDFKAKLAGYGLGISNSRTNNKDISSSLTKVPLLQTDLDRFFRKLKFLICWKSCDIHTYTHICATNKLFTDAYMKQ